MDADREFEISIVIPFFNEEGNVGRMVNSVRNALMSEVCGWEIILVDDGSSDGTWQEMAVASESDARVRSIGLSRNFGHQHALLAGFSAARGQAVISMDGDMQHPAEIIPELLSHWRQGSKVVATRRRYGEAAGRFKKITSRWFYSLFSTLADFPLEEGSSDFRLLDRSVLDCILKFRDANLFLRGAVQWVGFPTSTVEFVAAERGAGSSKYSFSRMMRFAQAGLLSFSIKPLRMGIWLGLLTSLMAFSFLFYVFVQHFRGNTVPGWASMTALVSLLFGVMFLVVGILGAYIGSIHQILQDRPRFIIDQNRRASGAETVKIVDKTNDSLPVSPVWDDRVD